MRTLNIIRGRMKREFSLPKATYDEFTLQELMSGTYDYSKYDTDKWELYIGRKDANGLDVYVGDIVKDNEGQIYLVRFSEENLGFTLYRWSMEYPDLIHVDYVVVGNSTDNPELLPALE